MMVLPRFFNLGIQPPGLHIDEVSFGMEAKSLVDVGKDTWGEEWPLYFKGFGEYKAPGLIYSTIPFLLLNNNQISTFITRLPSATMGIAALVAIYFLTGVLWRGSTVINKLLVTSIIAFSPWHFGSSRVYFETSGGSAWMMIGISLILAVLNSKSVRTTRIAWVLGTVAIVLSGYWYSSFRYVGIGVLFISWVFANLISSEKKKIGLVTLVIILTFGIGWVGELFSTKGLSRLNQFSTATDYGSALVSNQKREFCHLSFIDNPQYSKLCYFIWNKPVLRATGIATFMVEYMSLKYLFTNSGGEYGVDGDYGVYLLPAVIPYVVGFAYLIWSLFKSPFSGQGLILLWLVLSLVPPAFTQSTNIHRSVVALYIVMIIIIVGIREIYFYLKNLSPRLNYLFWIGYALVSIFYIIQSQANYFLVYTHSQDMLWTSDTQAIYSYVVGRQNEYDRIIDTALHGPLAGAFYGGISTDDIQLGRHSEPNPEGWTYLVQAGKYELIHKELRDLACQKHGESDQRKTLVITEKIDNLSQISEFTSYSWNKVDKMHQVYDLDKVVAYELDHNSSFKTTCTKK